MGNYTGLNKRLKVVSKPVASIDDNYGPYDNVEDALNSIPLALRAVGLTVGIQQNNNIVEYWFQDGITDSHLKEKKPFNTYFTNEYFDTYENGLLVEESSIHEIQNQGVIQLIDSYTKEDVNYEETSTWYDGSPMDDPKVDNVIYRKKGDIYYKRITNGIFKISEFGSDITKDNSDILLSMLDNDQIKEVIINHDCLVSKSITIPSGKKVRAINNSKIIPTIPIPIIKLKSGSELCDIEINAINVSMDTNPYVTFVPETWKDGNPFARYNIHNILIQGHPEYLQGIALYGKTEVDATKPEEAESWAIQFINARDIKIQGVRDGIVLHNDYKNNAGFKSLWINGNSFKNITIENVYRHVQLYNSNCTLENIIQGKCQLSNNIFELTLQHAGSEGLPAIDGYGISDNKFDCKFFDFPSSEYRFDDRCLNNVIDDNTPQTRIADSANKSIIKSNRYIFAKCICSISPTGIDFVTYPTNIAGAIRGGIGDFYFSFIRKYENIYPNVHCTILGVDAVEYKAVVHSVYDSEFNIKIIDMNTKQLADITAKLLIQVF